MSTGSLCKRMEQRLPTTVFQLKYAKFVRPAALLKMKQGPTELLAFLRVNRLDVISHCIELSRSELGQNVGTSIDVIKPLLSDCNYIICMLYKDLY